MIKASVFEAELVAGMHSELLKQASDEAPKLAKAAECLHAALEIFEQAGLRSQADDVLKLLSKIAQQSPKLKPAHEMPSITQLMRHGMTQRDMQEFSKGNPIAKAKLNLVLRKLGLSEHQIGRLIGTHNVMSEEDAKKVLDPSSAAGKIWEWIKNPNAPTDPSNVQPGETMDFKSIAQKKSPADHATKGLTPERMVENLKHHGTEFNMADHGCAVDVPPSLQGRKTNKDDMDADFAGLLESPSFDIDASDDELMGIEIKDDLLEVFDKEIPLSDFEDERD